MAVSSQFIQVYLNDYAAAQQDLSQYIDDINPIRDVDSIDVTSFRTGGKDVTQAKIRGALKSEFTISFIWSPTVEDYIVPLLGNNSGTLIDVRFGNGAAPTTGDDKLTGSYVICKVTEDYDASSTTPVMWKVDVKPVDGGASAPTWGTI